MERPTIDNTAAVHQAGSTIETYLAQAVAMLDKRFEPGFAERNPALVAELVRSQAMDFNNTSLTAALYALGDHVEEIGSVLATAADTLCNAVNPPKPKRYFDNP